MKPLYKIALLTSAMALALTACKEKTKIVTEAGQKIAVSSASSAIDRESYAVGATFGKEIKNMLEGQGDGLEQQFVQQGFNDAFTSKPQLTEEEQKKAMESLQKRMGEEAEVKQQIEKESVEKAQIDGDKFRAEFEKQDGVKKTESGLLYKIEKMGNGDEIKDSDTVVVHYKGVFLDGTEFDSSYKRNEPATIPLEMVVPGWREGIKLLQKGGGIKLVIPPELGYGERSVPGIPGNSTLIFDIELLDVNPKMTEEVAKK